MYRKNAFTLIELLVVISIIALLLSVLMPALNKAKLFAQEIVCRSNLRNYGLATEMYANDSDGKLPPSSGSLYKQGGLLPGEINKNCRWHNPLFNLETHPEFAGPYWTYLATTKANICPTFSKLAPVYGGEHTKNVAIPSTCIGAPFEPQYSYSMNYWLESKRKDEIKSPSRTFLWAEENMWTLKDISGNNLSTQVLNDNNLLAHAIDHYDCFGSFHKISLSQINRQQEDNTYYDIGVANVLLADGSTTWLSPLRTLDYDGEKNY